MERQFDRQLRNLKDQLMEMGALTETMVELAICSLTKQDSSYLKEIDELEKKANALEIIVDETVIELLALQQPVAHDLRVLLMSSKIASELERVADLAVNICQSVRYLEKYTNLDIPNDIINMGSITRTMLQDCLDALSHDDPSLAQKVLNADAEVNALKRQTLKSLVETMCQQSEQVPRAVSLILVSRNFERIGDYATNIAEEVIYLVQGREIRHHHETLRRAKES